MSAKTQQNGASRQSTMFPQGEDLPLFTGQAPTTVERPFVPQESFTQPSLIDLRPTLKGAEPKSEERKAAAV